MVRLKATPHSVGVNVPRFQFQYGAIERVEIYIVPEVQQLFQFQYGAIERIITVQLQLQKKQFQFQYGAIERCC